jgi:hypothetical protein
MGESLGRGPAAVLAVLTEEPASTSELYDRVGYPALMRAGLIGYPDFRAALAGLEAAGLAASRSGEDEDATVWWRRPGARR